MNEEKTTKLHIGDRIGLKQGLILLFAIFVLFVGYKYIASGIQENKEKSVIQERANAQQTSTPSQPISTTPIIPTSAKPFIPSFDMTNEVDCEMAVRTKYLQNWISACYLKELLTPTCKESFSVDGYYLGNENSWIMSLAEYGSKADACACTLPDNLAGKLNSVLQSGLLYCKKLL